MKTLLPSQPTPPATAADPLPEAEYAAVAAAVMNSLPANADPAAVIPPAPPEPPAHCFELRIYRALRQIIRSANLYSKHLTATADLTASQLNCLWCVVHQGPISATAIGREIRLSPSTLVGVLDRLEAKGLVTRERDPKDRRLQLIRATDQGVVRAGNAPSPLQQSLRDAVNAMPELEQATIALSLERIAELLEQPKPAQPPSKVPQPQDTAA